MPKIINRKCMKCSTIDFKGFVYLKDNTDIKSFKGKRLFYGSKIFPDCYIQKRCSRKRNYYKYLEKKRKYQRDVHRYQRYNTGICAICLSKDNLEVHHIKPQMLGIEDTKENCMTLCSKCHKIITIYYNSVRCIRDM